MKPVTYSVKTTVTKTTSNYGSEHFNISLEGAGFEGEAEGSFLGQVFEKAWQDLMAKVAEGVFDSVSEK